MKNEVQLEGGIKVVRINARIGILALLLAAGAVDAGVSPASMSYQQPGSAKSEPAQSDLERQFAVEALDTWFKQEPSGTPDNVAHALGCWAYQFRITDLRNIDAGTATWLAAANRSPHDIAYAHLFRAYMRVAVVNGSDVDEPLAKGLAAASQIDENAKAVFAERAAMLALYLYELETAKKYFEVVATSPCDDGDLKSRALVRLSLATVQANPAESERLLRRAVQVAKSPQAKAWAKSFVGEQMVMQKRFAEAVAYLDDAENKVLNDMAPDRFGLTRVLYVCGAAFAEAGDQDQACSRISRAADDKPADLRLRRQIYLMRSRCHDRDRTLDQRIMDLQSAASCGWPLEQWQALKVLGQVLKRELSDPRELASYHVAYLQDPSNPDGSKLLSCLWLAAYHLGRDDVAAASAILDRAGAYNDRDPQFGLTLYFARTDVAALKSKAK